MDTLLSLSVGKVCTALKKTNSQKAAGPDITPVRAPRACSVELADAFTDTYNTPLCILCTCFKSTIIVPFPKNNTVTWLNDYRPVT